MPFLCFKTLDIGKKGIRILTPQKLHSLFKLLCNSCIKFLIFIMKIFSFFNVWCQIIFPTSIALPQFPDIPLNPYLVSILCSFYKHTSNSIITAGGGSPPMLLWQVSPILHCRIAFIVDPWLKLPKKKNAGTYRKSYAVTGTKSILQFLADVFLSLNF